ncbi:protein phosphatase regulator, partial [Oleoguttula sp. CCFEE 5521]
MSRPNLVRADTIDLQDSSAPTAAEHTKHPAASTIAPHQAAEYQHVAAERHTEEQVLADAWHMAGQNGQHAGEPANNGEAAKEAGEGEGANGEEAGEGSDDDMMDRISSSPSIDDGAYESLLGEGNATLGRSSQRAHIERAGINYSSAMSPIREQIASPPGLLDRSSPYVDAPRYLPLGLDTFGREDWLSPSLHTPEESPLVGMARFGRFVSAQMRGYEEGRSGLEIARDRDDGIASVPRPDGRTGLGLDENKAADFEADEPDANDAGAGLRPLRSEAFPMRSTSIHRPYGSNAFARSLPRLTIPAI